MPQPLVTPARPEILGSLDHPEFKVEENQDIRKLKPGEYHSYMPLIGRYIDFYGSKTISPEHDTKLSDLTKNILLAFATEQQNFPHRMPSKELLNQVETLCVAGFKNEFFIRRTIIPSLYMYLLELHTSLEIDNSKILSIYKPIFSLLVKMKATYHNLRTNDATRVMFDDLLNFGLDAEAINTGFAHFSITGLEEFEEMLSIYLTAGADINSLCYSNPEFGTFLHIQIANELQEIPDVIAIIEKYRVKNKPNTQFKYATKDFYGNTPLLLAIRTRNELAALALINLDKTHSIGINIADSEGRSPLMLACAYGMKNVVAKLLEQGADPNVKDKAGKTYKDYASIDPNSLEELIAPFIHPHRVNTTVTTPHSYLYASEEPYLPLCFYKDGQILKGEAQKKHFVVLSNKEPYKRILTEAIETLNQQKDEASQNNCSFAIKQRDDIFFSAQYKRVLDYLDKNQDVPELLAWYRPFNQDYRNQTQLYEDSLKRIKAYLTKKAKELTSLKPHLEEIIKLKDSPPAISFMEECIEGEQEVRTYLATPEAQKLIILAQEKAETRIRAKEKALRLAAALGDLTTVQTLLAENVNPAAPEFKNECNVEDKPYPERNTLDWATWSEGMLGTIIRDQPEDKQVSTETALKAHPQIIKALLAHTVFSATTMKRVKEKLEDQIKIPLNLRSQEHAERCLETIENPEGSLTP